MLDFKSLKVIVYFQYNKQVNFHIIYLKTKQAKKISRIILPK